MKCFNFSNVITVRSNLIEMFLWILSSSILGSFKYSNFVCLRFCREMEKFFICRRINFYLKLCCIDPQYFKIHDHIQNFKRHPFGWRFFILQLINTDYSKCCWFIANFAPWMTFRVTSWKSESQCRGLYLFKIRSKP